MELKIRFRCYNCDRTHTVDSKAAGKKGRCPCGKLMVVPELRASGNDAGGDGDSLPVAKPPPGEPAAGPSADGWPRASDTGSSEAAPGWSGRQAASSACGQGAGGDRGGGERRSGGRGRGGWLSFLGGILELIVATAPLVAGLGFLVREEEIVKSAVRIPEPGFLRLPPLFWITLLLCLGVLLVIDGACRVARSAGE